ncbi:Oidioi.mRNA.OKI2018_I69.chr2.g8301.t1.cds [Oikopleura dioica]|uniref:Oidioi.mRNA.OKI2018_I69.chr2.g8301.t1.cds n=1 Tax=Oikopleura dioica TaxID=34765 RepID=A0ABN7T9D3_OIKDI|nr:Oidioi.mRNA.OKI2018_I69.chr2.g8301.t1.cds [Oikopleura dioica]
MHKAENVAENFFADPMKSFGVDSLDYKITSCSGNTIGLWAVKKETSIGSVLFCHGSGGNRASPPHRLAVLKNFTALNFNIVSFDYSGFGDSSGAPNCINVVEDTISAYKFMTSHFKGPYLMYGHSLGTAIAIEATVRLQSDENPVDGLICDSCLPSMRREMLEYPTVQLSHNMYNNGRFMSRPNFRRPMKKKKGNALAHLEKFTAVQQLAIFCPDLKINIEQHPTEAQYFKASCFMRGRQVEAFHKGKKNARQALCSKIIKQFKLLDDCRGDGASESMSIGVHLEEELPSCVSSAKSEPTSFKSEISSEQLQSMEVIMQQEPEVKNEQAGPLAKAHGYTGSYNSSSLLNDLDKMPAQPMETSSQPSSSNLMPPPVIHREEYRLPPARNDNTNKTPISILHERMRKDVDFQFAEAVRDINTGLFMVRVVFTDGIMFDGFGRNKKLAKHHAAALALESRFNMPQFSLPEGAGLGKADQKKADIGLLKEIDVMIGKAKKESFPSPSKDPLYIDPAKIISRVNELHPGIGALVVTTQDDGKQPLFHCSVTVNGTEFMGHGRAKKQAKFDMCSKIMRDLHGYNLKAPRAGQEIFCSEDIQTRGRIADKMQDAIVMKFNELCAKGVDQDAHKMKVLAGICMTREPVTDESEEIPTVIALGTGTKTMTGEHVSTVGTAVIDCHGEIISRRNLKRFFYSELQKIANGEGLASIFERKNGQGKFALRDGIKFHLYINTTTCGDARVFNPNSNDDFEDFNSSRMSRGILRSKIENGEGTVPINKEESVLTWDGIIGNARLKSMSCSDKVMRWNVLGLQGALLNQLIEPIYLSSISLGGLYHRQHFPRAMFERIENIGTDYASSFRLNKPMMSPCGTEEPRRAKNTPPFSINWCIIDEKLEKIDTVTGKQMTREPSRLCKRELFQLYLRTIEQLGPVVDKSYAQKIQEIKTKSYLDAKNLSTEYQTVKNSLYEKMKVANVGYWVKKPEEFESFSI